MLTWLQKILDPDVYDSVEAWITPPVVVNSFDCARFSMGVARVTIDPVVVTPGVRTRGHSLEDRIKILEALVRYHEQCLDNILGVEYIGVWDMGEGKRADDFKEAWDVAPPLRRRMDKLDRKFSPPDVLLYEFQMGSNDKSRMVSTMLAYHYASLKTVRIPAAVKNTLCPARALTREEFQHRCPRVSARRKKSPATGRMTTVLDLIYPKKTNNGETAVSMAKDLSIQTFLSIVTDTYDANKLHTSACLEWWAGLFHVDLRWVPNDCLDDAADAFMQVQGALRKRLI
jgi:hypothetical protein